MSELAEYIEADLAARFQQTVIDLGYWCPRCDVFAYPAVADHMADIGAPGWCPFWGLDPRAEGPAQPMHFAGIFGAITSPP